MKQSGAEASESDLEEQPSANRGSVRALAKRFWESVRRGQFGCFALVFVSVLVVLFLTDYRSNPPVPLLPAVGPRVPIPVVSPATLVIGRSMFKANACGDCHALRDPLIPARTSPSSTADEDKEGPDLTREGTRNPSIDWQMTNLTKHHRIWPTSMMPDCTDLSSRDLHGLAAYLASRK